MVTGHVEFGPSAEEVPLLQLSGPSSFVWKNMTCFLSHWSCVCVYVCVCVEILTEYYIQGRVLCQKYEVLVEILTKNYCSIAFIALVVK